MSTSQHENLGSMLPRLEDNVTLPVPSSSESSTFIAWATSEQKEDCNICGDADRACHHCKRGKAKIAELKSIERRRR